MPRRCGAPHGARASLRYLLALQGRTSTPARQREMRRRCGDA